MNTRTDKGTPVQGAMQEPVQEPMQAMVATFAPLTPERLDALLVVECSAHPHPWTRGNFMDALAANYQIQMLVAGGHILGYFVAMCGVDEVHLLNLTVTPAFQGQGWARLLLDALALWARGQGARCLWLEVRTGNTRARHVYDAHGWHCVGTRKSYYPASAQGGVREDAVVMQLPL